MAAGLVGDPSRCRCATGCSGFVDRAAVRPARRAVPRAGGPLRAARAGTLAPRRGARHHRRLRGRARCGCPTSPSTSAHGERDFAPEVERGRPAARWRASMARARGAPVVGRLRLTRRAPRASRCGLRRPAPARRPRPPGRRGRPRRGSSRARCSGRGSRSSAAREEERRRLRRDLHDGLGPALTGIALQLGAARNLPRTTRTRRASCWQIAGGASDRAIADVRRLVYELRPPALDELGLTGRSGGTPTAARRRGPRSTCTRRSDLHTVAGRGRGRRLPHRGGGVDQRRAARGRDAHRGAAVECNGALELDVDDDGGSMAAGGQPGVGLTSMRERAAELGGLVVVAPIAPHGTCVRAALPLAAP